MTKWPHGLMPIFIGLLATFYSSSSQSSPAQAKLPEFQLTMNARSYGFPSINTQGQLQLTALAQGYEMSMQARTRFAQQQESSRFRVQDEQIISQSYQSNSRISFFSETKSYQFGPGGVHGQVNGRDFSHPDTNSYDPLNQLMAMSLKLQQQQDRFSLAHISWTRPNQHDYQVTARGQLDTQLGPLNVVEITRLSGPSNEKHRFWFASDYDFVPVRWRQEKDGKVEYEINLVSGRVNGKSIQATTH